MSVWRNVKLKVRWAALLAGLFVSPHAAAAHSWRHHRHHYAYPPLGYGYRPQYAYRNYGYRAYPDRLEDIAPASAGFGPTAPGISSIVVDAGTGRVIEESGADTPRYPASLTKLMTLDLAFEAIQDGRMTLDTELPVSYHAASVEPVKLGLQPGSYITVRQAILAMTTMSANDAATALGEYLGGGSEARCAQMMTLRAHALGMAQTEFYNASGLPNPYQITTARDLSILARDIVVSFPEDQPFFEVQAFDFNGESVYSNNGMLKIYPGATGMKTGYTVLARHNLITSAERNGEVLIGVVLHEPSWGASYQDMTAMLDGGFGTNTAAPQMDIAQAQQPPGQAAAPPQPAQPVVADSRDWTAQLGLYARRSRARIVAIRVRHICGVGIARIARVERHGHTLWNAQLAGLSFTAAHETCSELAAHGSACQVLAPYADHLALADFRDNRS